MQHQHSFKYDDFHTIDWPMEFARDRYRHQMIIKYSRQSLSARIMRQYDAASGWVCVLLVGICSGIDVMI